MKTIFSKVSATCKRWGRSHRDAVSARYRQEIWNGIVHDVQFMEFDGDLYLSYKGTPLVDVRHLGYKSDAYEHESDQQLCVLEFAREAAYRYSIYQNYIVPNVDTGTRL